MASRSAEVIAEEAATTTDTTEISVHSASGEGTISDHLLVEPEQSSEAGVDETCHGNKAVGVDQVLSDIKVSSHFNEEDLHGPDNVMDTSDDIDLANTPGDDDELLDHNSSIQELISNPLPAGNRATS